MTRSRLEFTVATALLSTSLMLSPRSIAAPQRPLSNSHSEFCSEVQRRLVDTALPITNVLEKDYETFKLSKPAVSPVRTHQYVARNERLDILQISCKTKTADHLRSAAKKWLRWKGCCMGVVQIHGSASGWRSLRKRPLIR